MKRVSTCSICAAEDKLFSLPLTTIIPPCPTEALHRERLEIRSARAHIPPSSRLLETYWHIRSQTARFPLRFSNRLLQGSMISFPTATNSSQKSSKPKYTVIIVEGRSRRRDRCNRAHHVGEFSLNLLNDFSSLKRTTFVEL